MVEINPIEIMSSYWSRGFALDRHTISSIPIGEDSSGRMQYDTERTPIGELLFKFKYRDDSSALVTICDTAAQFLKAKLLSVAHIQRIVTVPPSSHRKLQPATLIATGIAERLGISYNPDSLERISTGTAAKNTDDLDERRESQSKAFRLAPGTKFQNLYVLLIDDVYSSGATSEAAARVLLSEGGAAEVFFFAVTKTRKGQ